MAALIYLVILVVTVAFSILYRDMLALLLLITVIAVPLLSLLILMVIRLLTRVRLGIADSTVTLGNTAVITVNIKNNSPFSVGRLRIAMTVKNRYIDAVEKQTVNICVPPFSSGEYKIKIMSEHIGVVNASIKRVAVYGFFGVASFGYRAKKDYKIVICPPLNEVGVKLRQNMYSISESNVFSKHKPGDDPSEVFAIRDYVGGDKLNRMHWKLSTKQDSLMVKDYSLPVSESVLILADLCDTGENCATLADGVIETVFSLSFTLLHRRVMHAVGWYSVDGGTVFVPIETSDDLFAAMGLFLQSSEYCDDRRLNDLEQEVQQGRSHIVYVSPNVTAGAFNAFAGSLNTNILPSAVSVVCDKKTDKANGDTTVVHCGNIVSGLDGAEL